MCPITKNYINNQYIDTQTNTPCRIQENFEIELVQKAKRVLRLVKQGKPLVFPDILNIERLLLLQNLKAI